MESAAASAGRPTRLVDVTPHAIEATVRQPSSPMGQETLAGARGAGIMQAARPHIPEALVRSLLERHMVPGSSVPAPHPTALLGREPRKPGIQTYSSSEPCTRVASNSVMTVTPGTGFSTTSTMTVSAAASPCCGGGPGAFVGAFFVTARFALALVTRFLGVVLAATRLATLVLAARLGALPRFTVAFRAAPRFFR